MSHGSPNLLEFFGRFHPVLVHLPIGFLILLGTQEALALRPRFRYLAASSRTVLVLSAATAAVSAMCGWLLALSGGYDAKILFWHRWTGTGLAVAVLTLLVLHWRGWVWAYRGALATTLVLLCVASHFGGTLTHGRGYLAQFAPDFLRPFLGGIGTGGPQPRRAAGDVMVQPVYDAVIQPILTRNCVACHGPSKSKAGLRLDSLENLLGGGDDGPVIEPGNVGQSLLLQRLRLPLEDEDHMPPEGKRQPSDAELVLLQWWIEIGAPADKTVRELNPPETVLRALGSPAKASP